MIRVPISFFNEGYNCQPLLSDGTVTTSDIGERPRRYMVHIHTVRGHDSATFQCWNHDVIELT
jgi:hypothetical protein